MELSLKLLVLYKKNKKHRGRGDSTGFLHSDRGVELAFSALASFVGSEMLK